MSGFDGRTLAGVTRIIGPAKAFWLRVSGNGGLGECWVWTGASDGNGYGRVSYRGGEKYAHREAWVQLFGEIPAGLELDHLCRNPPCVNPWHLDPVSPRVNVRRGVSPGAKSLAREVCEFGHSYVEWGAINTAQRRICRLCRAAYAKASNARRASGSPTTGIDLREALADYPLESRIRLARKSPHRLVEPTDMAALALEIERDRRELTRRQQQRSAA